MTQCRSHKHELAEHREMICVAVFGRGKDNPVIWNMYLIVHLQNISDTYTCDDISISDNILDAF